MCSAKHVHADDQHNVVPLAIDRLTQRHRPLSAWHIEALYIASRLVPLQTAPDDDQWARLIQRLDAFAREYDRRIAAARAACADNAAWFAKVERAGAP
jgi:hypothetical protein